MVDHIPSQAELDRVLDNLDSLFAGLDCNQILALEQTSRGQHDASGFVDAQTLGMAPKTD